MIQESIRVGCIFPACDCIPWYPMSHVPFPHPHPLQYPRKEPGNRDTHPQWERTWHQICPPTSVNRLTDTCENITFPRTYWTTFVDLVSKFRHNLHLAVLNGLTKLWQPLLLSTNPFTLHFICGVQICMSVSYKSIEMFVWSCLRIKLKYR